MSFLLLALPGCGLSALNNDEPRGPGANNDEAAVGFSARYRVSSLAILAELDTDGDGEVDNHLPEGLELLDFAVPDSGFGLDAFNQRLREHVTELRPVYFDVRISDVLQLDVLSSDLDEDGVVRVVEDDVTTLSGTVDDAGVFEAGPGDITLDVLLRDDLPSVPLGLLETEISGDLLDVVLSGRLRTLISIDSVVADVIEPSIPDEGWDVDRDGTPEPKNEVMGIVANLAELLADNQLEDGSPAISAVLSVDAEVTE